jgi:hypothetical protein
MIIDLLWFLRLLLYLWAFYELGGLALIYYTSYKYSGKTGILALALLMISIASFPITLVALSLSTEWVSSGVGLGLRNLLIIPTLAIAVSTRHIRTKFINRDK